MNEPDPEPLIILITTVLTALVNYKGWKVNVLQVSCQFNYKDIAKTRNLRLYANLPTTLAI